MFQKLPSDLRNELEEIVESRKLQRPTLAQLKVNAECLQYGRDINPDSLYYKRRLAHYEKNTGVNA
ncbi:hypothetical protein HN865_00950 [Candidatus Woesearchaeota archaeon]|jgi:hypothetical protein|nr:hypothetical protein [Candidatus Woesearchaeota archaeon]MBT7237404.1 hypothetical protein [Candidatus Woesearchaeota archaeon]